jgi:hypothetical protein
LYLSENAIHFEDFIINDLRSAEFKTYHPDIKDYRFYLYYVDLPTSLMDTKCKIFDTIMVNNYENYLNKNALFWFYKILASRGSEIGIQLYAWNMIRSDSIDIIPEIQYAGFFRQAGFSVDIAKELIRQSDVEPALNERVIELIKFFPSQTTKQYLMKYSNIYKYKEKALQSLQYLKRYDF